MADFNGRRPDGKVTSSSESGLVDKYRGRFEQEALNLSHLRHDNVVRVLDRFSALGTHYYVMEYVEGENLDAYVKRRGALPEAEALAVTRDVASALRHMHNHHMLHLDVKPNNVMRRASDGHIFLIDFGLSKQYDE